MMIDDLRSAARSLRRDLGFTSVVLVTLAVAIGANSAVFSVADGVLRRPLPYPDPDRLVTVAAERHPRAGLRSEMPFSDRGFWHFVDNNRAFERFGGYLPQPVETSFVGAGEPVSVGVGAMTVSAFEALGLPPVLGRLPSAAEGLPGGPQVALLRHSLWVRLYGGDPSVLGQVVELNDASVELIGVMPEEYAFPHPDVELWRPLPIDPLSENFGAHTIRAVARLVPGVTIEEGVEDAERLISTFTEAGYNASWMTDVFTGGAVVRELKDHIVGDTRQPLLILLGAVGFVFLIACGNLANLFLVRAEARETDWAVRVAFGSGRLRLVRLALVESMLLALGGGALGAWLAYLGTRALAVAAPANLPRVGELGIRGSTLLFTLGLSVLAALLFGALPSLRLGGDRILTRLSGGGRGSATSGGRQVARSALIVIQVALALILLVGSGLMVRSFSQLRAVDAGFVATDVLTFSVRPGFNKYRSPASVAQFYSELFTRLEAIPAVASVGGSTALPLSGSVTTFATRIEEFPTPDGERPPSFFFQRVTPGYFETLGIPIVEGRPFEEADHVDRLGSLIISASIKARYWPTESALGKRLIVGPPATTVGVVGDVHSAGLDNREELHVYKPMLDSVGGGVRRMTIYVRANTETAALVSSIRGVIADLDPDLPISDVRPMERVVADSMSGTTLVMTLLLLAATIALLMGSLGIYGVISYVVSRREGEIGIRLALGAEPDGIRAMVLRQTLKVTLVGIAIGILGAVAFGRLLASLLFGVEPTDPWTLIGGAICYLIVAAAAGFVPAVRASRASPATALRGS